MVHPWLIHVNVWQKPPQYCEVISLQLKKIVLGKLDGNMQKMKLDLYLTAYTKSNSKLIRDVSVKPEVIKFL